MDGYLFVTRGWFGSFPRGQVVALEQVAVHLFPGGPTVKPPSWTDSHAGSEATIGFIRLWVWYQLTEEGLDRWGFAFMGYRSEVRYRSRDAAKLACLRFAKKFMTEAIEAIDQTEGYSDPTPGTPKDKVELEAKAKAEDKWIASLFSAGLVK